MSKKVNNIEKTPENNQKPKGVLSSVKLFLTRLSMNVEQPEFEPELPAHDQADVEEVLAPVVILGKEIPKEARFRIKLDAERSYVDDQGVRHKTLFDEPYSIVCRADDGRILMTRETPEQPITLFVDDQNLIDHNPEFFAKMSES